MGVYMVTNDSIRKDFGIIMNLIKRQCAKIENKNSKCALTPKQGIIIGFIHSHIKNGEDVFQKDIEKEFSLRRSSASEILALMEKNGLITREQTKDDARMKKLVLTQKAENFLQKVKQDSDAITDLAFKDVSDEEKETLDKILKKVIRNLEEK